MIKAPEDWYYFSFPLSYEDKEVISLLQVTEIGHALMDRAEEMGDQSHFGSVPHWAHLLKIEQGPDGDWPVYVNARTGEAVGEERTCAPATLLARLGRVLRSTEFDAAVERTLQLQAM
jgi:hypothetical protein